MGVHITKQKTPIYSSDRGEITTRDTRTLKMKTFALIAVAAAADKKVPPRHPLQRLNKLITFAAEWCNDDLSAKQATHWILKFDNNVDRFGARWARCGYYDENHEHGGPADRKRRDLDEMDCSDLESDLCRYDKSNPIRGIKQITSGFRKWAERYLANDRDGAFCKLQPAKQVARANKWHDKLVAKLAANL